MELHYDKKHCKVFFDATVPCVYLQWEGFALSEQFREACDFSLELMTEKGVDKMIADNTNAKIVQAVDQKWMMEDWFPRAYNQGYRSSAVIVAEDVFRDLTVKDIVNQMEEGKFTVQFFQDEDKAREWLRLI